MMLLNYKYYMKNYHDYQSLINTCLRCAAICNHCASSCTQEKDVQMMARCIQLDMECAATCYAAAQLMSLGSEHAIDICRTCATICESCGTECSKHHNEHCRECSRVCKECADECRKMAA
ncbi:MAG: four-helix bundle copper-binding protein [Bacteroidota bacterium]